MLPWDCTLVTEGRLQGQVSYIPPRVVPPGALQAHSHSDCMACVCLSMKSNVAKGALDDCTERAGAVHSHDLPPITVLYFIK